MNILVIGAGAWGTTTANLLAEDENNQVKIWCYEEEVKNSINKNNINSVYLPDIKLNKKLEAVDDMKFLRESDLGIIAVPSLFFENILNQIKELDVRIPFVILTKGFHIKSSSLITDLFKKILPHNDFAVLSGPNLATEIAQKKPGSCVVAGTDNDFLIDLQKLFFREYFRVYTVDDYIGVQIGGAFKNIIAIGAGICDAFGYGLNTKAAYLTRGLVEMTRFGVENGAKPYTFIGLSGVGDLIATANSTLSRNYSFGFEIGKAERLPMDIYKDSKKAIEGVLACEFVYKIAKQNNIDIPITEAIFDIIFNNKDIYAVIKELMNRDPKEEIY